VFDLDTYNKTAPQPYTIKWINPITECLAPEYSRCMLPLWPNGAQNVEYREFDLLDRSVGMRLIVDETNVFAANQAIVRQNGVRRLHLAHIAKHALEFGHRLQLRGGGRRLLLGPRDSPYCGISHE
jgi:hypothetical protein